METIQGSDGLFNYQLQFKNPIYPDQNTTTTPPALQLSVEKRFEHFFLPRGFAPYLGSAVIVQVAILVHEHHIADNLVDGIIYSRENINPVEKNILCLQRETNDDDGEPT